MTPKQTELLRSLPAVGELLEIEEVSHWCEATSRTAVVQALRTAIEEFRKNVLADGEGVTQVDAEAILHLAEVELVKQSMPSLCPVINATGVVLHTGLGRAPLCSDAIEAVAEGAAGYTNLEFDLESGKRGRRTAHVAGLLCELTGAEAAAVVNNNAAAVLLVLHALCDQREVIISRGQLIEIGGSFRMPDIMAASGAILREVGTTNRTRIADYASAINENTAALFRAHQSNFRIVGFSAEPTIEEIAACAHEHDLIAIDDVGSGAMFDLSQIGLPAEPYAGQSIAAGADIVCFSGDKLLGGPQAGIIVGRGDLIDRIDSHPLMRTYRVDKLVLLALEATLRRYQDTESAVRDVPTLSMLCATTEALARRARELERMLSEAMPDERFYVGSDVTFAGGGSLPGRDLPTVVIRWQPSFASVDDVVARLRRAETPVIVRIRDDAICFDLRTITDDDFETLTNAVASTAPDNDNGAVS